MRDRSGRSGRRRGSQKPGTACAADGGVTAGLAAQDLGRRGRRGKRQRHAADQAHSVEGRRDIMGGVMSRNQAHGGV